MKATCFAAALAVGILSAAPTADAYVESRTSTGTALAWRQACRDLRIAGSDHGEIDRTELTTSLTRAFAAWRGPFSSCTRFDAQVSSTAASASDVAYDGENVVVVRDAAFCRDPLNAGRDVCAAPHAAAVTTLFFIDKPGDPRDGEILDVDIAVNGIDFTYGSEPGQIDLDSVLTHEVGHYLGLAHTCYTDRANEPPPASNGTLTPYCYPLSQLDTTVKDATMFNFIKPGETNKRAPSQDEWHGICAMYSEHPGGCDPSVTPQGCGGCTAGSGVGAAGILMLFSLAPFFLSRRRS